MIASSIYFELGLKYYNIQETEQKQHDETAGEKKQRKHTTSVKHSTSYISVLASRSPALDSLFPVGSGVLPFSLVTFY